MSIVLMRVLESAPSRYDRGIALLTLGHQTQAYARLAARIQPGWRVLDLGTGTGALALRAAARGAKVVAIDINPAMLTIARHKAQAAGLADQLTWREMGVAELDTLPDRAFDALCAGMCFSELTPQERRYTLLQAQRLLRPGGLLLLADEVRPRGLGQRLLHSALRAPLVVITWLLTQATTHAVPDLHNLVESAGFEVTATQMAMLNSWAEVVARTPEPEAADESKAEVEAE
jgi:demethylmenaquinone methyltransferase/2-methoxy-6-polyprenyl-1,4-benzoquinol methylase